MKRVAVIGRTFVENSRTTSKAIELGRLLGQNGHIVVTGGVSGYPDIVAHECVKNGGTAEAFIFAPSVEDSKKFYNIDFNTYSIIRPIDAQIYNDKGEVFSLYQRSLDLSFDVDCSIVIGGGTGTLFEFIIMYGLQKPIGVLLHTGGVTKKAIKVLLKDLGKSDREVVFAKRPDIIVNKLGL